MVYFNYNQNGWESRREKLETMEVVNAATFDMYGRDLREFKRESVPEELYVYVEKYEGYPKGTVIVKYEDADMFRISYTILVTEKKIETLEYMDAVKVIAHDNERYISRKARMTCKYLGLSKTKQQFKENRRYEIRMVEEVEHAHEEGYVQCKDCGKWIPEDEALVRWDGARICGECYDMAYFTCEDCGEIHYMDDAFPVNDKYSQILVCEDCVEEYPVCIDCGERYLENLGTEDTRGRFLCNSCRDNNGWSECYDCGRWVSQYDVSYDEEDDPFCPECWSQHRRREHEYGFKPEPIFYGNENDELLFGIEDEVDDGEDKSECLKSINEIRNEDYLYMKHDGSLNCGFEMVSHPMRLEYHMKNMPWKEIFDTVKSYGYKSHDTDTCGLHIHVGRKGIGSLENVQKIVFLVEKHWDNLLKFTRRKRCNIEEWADRDSNCDWISESFERSYNIFNMIDRAKNDIDPWSTRTRYTAVNRCNGNTIEFRVFRGTLNHTTFIATIQFVSNICKYAMNHSWEEVVLSTWEDVALYERYTELDQYLEKRGLMPQKPQQPDEEFDYDVGVFEPQLATA